MAASLFARSAFFLALFSFLSASATAGALFISEHPGNDVVERLAASQERLEAYSHGLVQPLFRGRSMPSPSTSCATNGEPRIFGLLIGASDGPADAKLEGPPNDVELLGAMLASVGAKESNIHALTGDKATRDAIVVAAWDILDRLECYDKVFFYYGGTALTWDGVVQHLGSIHDEPTPDTGALNLARGLLDDGRFRSHWPENASTLRSQVDLLEWSQDSGIVLFLNRPDHRGAVATGHETITAADLSDLVTLFRNHRADVTVLLDTCYASDAGLFRRQTSDGTPWRADVGGGPESLEVKSLVGAPTLVDYAGELAVFYSSIDQEPSIETRFTVGGVTRTYGLFTFRVAQTLLEKPEATLRDARDGLRAIVAADDSKRSQIHRIEGTNERFPIFAHSGALRQNTDTIRILQPSGLRGAAAVEVPQLEIVGALDWHAPTRAVLVAGQPATVGLDGRFSSTVNLKAGVNTISVLAHTADGQVHLIPPIELTYDGDIGKLRGEGRRLALIIANQNYLPSTNFASLKTPLADARALQAILSERYGFSTSIPMTNGDDFSLFLADAGKQEIEEALYMLSQAAGPQDTVLIYYAGHGAYYERSEDASWVPVDAERQFNYLPGATVNHYIAQIMARSVIVISDSCYAGALRSGTGEAPFPADISETDRARALMRMAQGQARLLLASGGTEPVLDEGGGGHSIFARALLTGLERMKQDAFSARELFSQYVFPMVSSRADQTPQFRPLADLGHDPSADIVFVRTEARDDKAELQ